MPTTNPTTRFILTRIYQNAIKRVIVISMSTKTWLYLNLLRKIKNKLKRAKWKQLKGIKRQLCDWRSKLHPKEIEGSTP